MRRARPALRPYVLVAAVAAVAVMLRWALVPGFTLHDPFELVYLGPMVAALGLLALRLRRAEALTACERAESALRESEAEFRSVFEQAALGMGRVSFEDARWLDVNDAFCAMLGYTREQMLSTPWPRMTHPEDVDLDLVPFRRMAIGELDSYTVEKRFIHRAGHAVWARLTLSLVRDARGRPQYEIAIVENVTERKHAEQQLLDADRRKNEFLAVLSHELRNPLAPIRNSVHVLERAAPGSDQASRARQVIDRQAQQMTHLVDDMLDVTRISRGKVNLHRERLDLRAVARAAAEDHRSLFTRSGIRLVVEDVGEPVYVEGDRIRLAQVIGNLLHNAVKFTPHGGTTELVVEDGGDGQAVIRVRDTGAGMSQETLERLFEPFMQAEQTLDRTRGGLGLGLALVKGLVEMHGGTVTARSDGLGKGSEITLTLPLQSAAKPRLSIVPTAPTPEAERRARRILVIEDNADAAESLREVLELGEHQVAVAYSGPEGLATAHEFRPDVVVCDIGLPGLDGYGVARAMRADPSLRSTTLVALSGYALHDDVLKSMEAGFDRHMAKPPSIDALEKVLAEAPARATAG